VCGKYLQIICKRWDIKCNKRKNKRRTSKNNKYETQGAKYTKMPKITSKEAQFNKSKNITWA